MLYLARKLIDSERAKDLARRLIMSPGWSDGILSAPGTVKRNLQLKTGEIKTKFSEEIIEIIKNDDLISNTFFPSKIFNILFTRTGSGMYYGPHTDLPYLPTGRRDLSFTIFLNQPDEYQGGELILYMSPDKKSIKLNPGEMIIYPTNYLHEVKEVTHGERRVCVGWIESQIPRDDDRNSLALLNAGISAIEQQLGKTPATQNLRVGYQNIYKRFLN